MNSGLKASPKQLSGVVPDASTRRGRMNPRGVPGRIVERTTISWRVVFSRRASPISLDTSPIAVRLNAPFRPLGVPTHTMDMSVRLTASIASLVAARCPLFTVLATSSSSSRSMIGDRPRTNQIDLGINLVCADYDVPPVREAGCANGANISQSKHAYPHIAPLLKSRDVGATAL